MRTNEQKSRLGIGELLMEARMFAEYVAFAASGWALHGSKYPPKTVLLIPGFMAGDATLIPLADHVHARGHRVFFSGIACNVNCPRATLRGLHRVLEKASHESGGKVVIVGHSLGGLYARELAHQSPHLVERVILLGAPINKPFENASPLVRRMAKAVNTRGDGCVGELCVACGMALAGTPPPVPETLIFTKTDGIVRWTSCLESGAEVESVEVRGSHCGLVFNLEALGVILDRLDRPSGIDLPVHEAERPTAKAWQRAPFAQAA